MKKLYPNLSILWIALFSMAILAVGQAQSVCNENTFGNAKDPNTLEYDNIVSLYHATMIKDASGDLRVWGASAAPNGTDHQLSPRTVKPSNGYNYEGEVLKFTGGAHNTDRMQFMLLSTEGLYVWGKEGILISEDLTSDPSFQKLSAIDTAGKGSNYSGDRYSLPNDVTPEDVNMLFGTKDAVGITTTDGAAWVLAVDKSSYGDGSDKSDNQWHRVMMDDRDPLTDVVAMRGTYRGMMALTLSGEVYTWGEGVYLGDGDGPKNLAYATKMTLPNESKPKMIGMTNAGSSRTARSHYILTQGGRLYSLGQNDMKQLGDFTTDEQKNWDQVKKSENEEMDGVRWMSVQEHSWYVAAVSVITANKKLYSWGSNSKNMIGTDEEDVPSNPVFMPGGLDKEDEILAVSQGGHTTMVIRECSSKFGYVGHKIHGSMADGNSVEGHVSEYDFDRTAGISICGAVLSDMPDMISAEIDIPCGDSTVDLNAIYNGDPSDIEWYVEDNRNADKVDNPDSAEIGTYYAFLKDYEKCPNVYAVVEVKKSQCIQLSGKVFVDNNADTVQQSGEESLTDVIVKLMDGETEIASTTTDADGDYSFEVDTGADRKS